MTRFWITMRQGVEFVLSSLELMQGGEVFVPKIPSLKLTDFAVWLAPNLKQKFVGIRPGEKLHEALLTEDDAPYTLDLDERYVIMPRFRYWTGTHFDSGGTALVPEGFRYASDTNKEWLDQQDLRDMLKEVDA